MPETKKKVILTGGHLSPALSVLPELLRSGYEVVFVGRRSALSKNIDLSLEYRLLANNPQLKFIDLVSGRFTKGAWISLPGEILKSLVGFFHSLIIVAQEKPDHILSFGGYLALPVCLAAALYQIPIYLHEQTAAPGKANRLLAKIATKIGVALPESLPYFPKTKTKLVGIALRPELISTSKTPSWYTGHKPCLLITGGSTGAHRLNQKIDPLIATLTRTFSVVHQTGDNEYKDFEHFSAQKMPNYFPRKYLLPSEMSFFLGQSQILVGRSGANTFFEIIHFKKPSVLMPLALSANNEQLQQAKILESAGVARIISETDSSESLDKQIKAVYQDQAEIKKSFQKLSVYAKLITDAKQFLKEFGL